MRRWTSEDYQEAGIPLWGLAFEMVEHVDPEIQMVVMSECPDQRLTFNRLRHRFQLVSRCPEGLCREAHTYDGHMYGSPKAYRGWYQLTEFDVDGEFMDVSLEDIRAWKHACDAQRKASEDEGIAKLMRTPEQMEADLEEESDRDLDETVEKFQEKFDTIGRSSKPIIGGRAKTTLWLPPGVKR